MSSAGNRRGLRVGWAERDITPSQPVLIAGQFNARLSEGVADPITVTALALDGGDDHVVFANCDLVTIPNTLRDAVRALVAQSEHGPDPMKVVLHATHTHTGPELRVPEIGAGHVSSSLGVELPAMPVAECVQFAAEGIADAVTQAWQSRETGSVAFGQGFAVVGRNRRSVSMDGESTMYGDTNTPDFSHIEGYEDHSVNVLATYADNGALTGLLVNVPCPAQVTEGDFVLSADYWCETRRELRQRFGKGLPVLAQCSAAGDQSPHLLFDKRAAERMLALSGRTEREEIGHRIADAVEGVLDCVGETADAGPVLIHRIAQIDIPLAALTERDVQVARREAEALRVRYEQEKRKLDENPDMRREKRWYCDITAAYRKMRWYEGVIERFERQQSHSTIPVELHVIRLGDAVFATNPFEYYLDFGIRIKARSKAVQTFLAQLAGAGTYVPSPRSEQGGGYGSIPASNPVGSEGGRLIADKTVDVIDQLLEGPGAIE